MFLLASDEQHHGRLVESPIAIGAMIDAAIIMVENAHKSLEHFREEHGREPNNGERIEVIVAGAAKTVGPAIVLLAACHHGEFSAGIFTHGAGRAVCSNRSRSQKTFLDVFFFAAMLAITLPRRC